MKIPRDLDGEDLAKALRVLGYTVTRQTGSHMRVTTELGGQHHEVIPNHSPLKLGTLRSILKSVAAHHRLSIDELAAKLGF